jgi:hypothetical protein
VPHLIAPLLLVLAQLAGAAPDAPKPDPAALEEMARRALGRVEVMRKQKLSKPLKMGVKDRDEVTKFIQQRLADEYGPAKVAAEGRLLQLHGLLPAGLDYGGFITSLLAEQVAGFYDHTRQELHIASWLPLFMQEPVMAHEIFHAIQDQEWGGGALIDSKKHTHDAVLAHAALLEGDATLVMLNYAQAEYDPTADMSTSKFAINMVATSLPLQMSSAQFPIMASAPDYLKQSLIFPYQRGLLFVAALRQGGRTWDDIRKVYDDPPASSEQILHPEKYWPNRDTPSVVKLPAPLWPGFARGWEGTAGEFHFQQMLLGHLEVAEAAEAAAGWDGDHTVLETSGEQAVAVTLSTWDTPEDAAAFEAALRRVYDARKAPRPALVTERDGTTFAFAFSADAALARKAVDTARAQGAIERR